MKTPSRSPIPTVRKKASEVEPSPILPATIDAVCQPAPAGKILDTATSAELARRSPTERSWVRALTLATVRCRPARVRGTGLIEGRGGEARGQPARGDRREGRGTLCQRCKREERDGAHGS